MAENTVNTNGGKGKQANGTGMIFGHSPEVIKERERMEAELELKVIHPLGLLAGALAGIEEEEGKDVPNGRELLRSAGYLLGLIVHGIRKEVSFQFYGLDKEALYGLMLEKVGEKGFFGKGR